MTNTASQFRQALSHHRAGNLARAGALYRRVLKLDPRHSDAMHLLGVIAGDSGQPDIAAALIAEAIRIRGPVPSYCASLGRVFGQRQMWHEAIACYRQALSRDPLNPAIHFNLGIALRAAGRLDEAILAFEQVCDLEPASANAWLELGSTLYAAGRPDPAARCYERAIHQGPDSSKARYNLAVLRAGQGRWSEARDLLLQAVKLQPFDADAHNNLGSAYRALSDPARAHAHFRTALKIQASHRNALENLARLLWDEGRLEESLQVLEDLAKHHPGYAAAYRHSGFVQLELARPSEAAESFRRCLGTTPEDAQAQWGLAFAELSLANFETGWPLYEWRFRAFPSGRHFDPPAWNGQFLDGRPILLYAEQGFGDTIQFVRYAPFVKNRGGSVIVECQPGLRHLLETVEGIDQVVGRGDPLPPFDCHASLMSLPRIFNSVPMRERFDIPYLFPDSDATEKWRALLRRDLDPGFFRVGLTWAGNPGHRNDRKRSVPPEQFNSLADLDRVAWFALQKEARSQPELPFTALPAEIPDFAETAAAILNLDLIISVDTAVAHLAGALGKPVWTLLPHAPDWRWMMDREDTPWYPTMRLFRQPRRGDWAPVIETLRRELDNLTARP
jgi:tetratricopeptide (TPR) repeat protein